MTRSEVFCAVALLLAVPGAALAGLYPGALQGIGGGDDRAAAFTAIAAKTATPTVAPKPPVSGKMATPPAPTGTQVSATGMVRNTSGPTAAVGGANHSLPGQIGGSSFTPKH